MRCATGVVHPIRPARSVRGRLGLGLGLGAGRREACDAHRGRRVRSLLSFSFLLLLEISSERAGCDGQGGGASACRARPLRDPALQTCRHSIASRRAAQAQSALAVSLTTFACADEVALLRFGRRSSGVPTVRLNVNHDPLRYQGPQKRRKSKGKKGGIQQVQDLLGMTGFDGVEAGSSAYDPYVCSCFFSSTGLQLIERRVQRDASSRKALPGD